MTTDQRPPPLVLFIHDHTSVVHLIAYLKNHGLRVTNAQNDGDMLEVIVKVDPDLIVLDFAVNGPTVKRIKEDRRTVDVPIIALADLCHLSGGDEDISLSGGEDIPPTIQ
jgi:DNA-binding response OmpR family regulator